MIGVLMILKEDMNTLLVYGCPSAICLLLDMWFSYCLYSFSKQSLRKRSLQVIPKFDCLSATNSDKNKNSLQKKRLSKSLPEFDDDAICKDVVKNRPSVV